MRRIFAAVALALLAVVIGFFVIPEPDPFPAVPLPELGDGPITLRVVRALNPRFDALSEDKIADVLDQTAQLVQFHFGLDVKFEREDDYDILGLMKLLLPAAIEAAMSLTYELTNPGRAPNRLARMISEDLKNGQPS